MHHLHSESLNESSILRRPLLGHCDHDGTGEIDAQA